MTRTRSLAAASLGVAVLAGVISGWPIGRWRDWERGLEDQMLALRGQRRPPAQVVVVPIDDATLQQGDWYQSQPQGRPPAWAVGTGTLPWPRAAYGLLASRLIEAGASAVAVNVVFAGPSGRGPADDRDLAAQLRRYPGRVALAAEMLEPEDALTGSSGLTLIRPEAVLEALGGPERLGLGNTLPAEPGEPPRHPEAYGRRLLPANGVEPFPSLSATTLRLAGRSSRQHDAAMALNVYGPEGTFPRIPAWEVLDPGRWRGHPLRPAVRGSVVLIGPVVSQGEAGNPTPFGRLSGLEILATATANSLGGDGLAPWPTAAPWRALLAMLPLLVVSAVALRGKHLSWRLGWVGVGLLALVLAGWFTFLHGHRWLPLLGPAGGLVLLGLLYGGEAYQREESERRRLRRTFERYVAPSVVAEILSDPAAAEGMLRGRVRPVTVLFSDLIGFTQLTQKRGKEGHTELHVRQLNRYLGAMVAVITDHGGTIDKFIGDAVMAVFGSPLGRGERQEALAALSCARAMRRALEQLNIAWRAEGVEPLNSGIGLASGPAMVGQIGSPQRLEFTVIGDTVNLASRLEGQTRPLQVPVVFDAATAELVRGEFPVRPLGPVLVKGMGEIPVYTLESDPSERA
ncbi:adenylate/guanylate cyclase domain-containing protein [Synechococcus sp. Cruz-9H2]|uniref:adenylate/guanylate cyclase domain-containing protein n=1 Tax=unclassified Synechococcus TaxID=2626047 RepID=UPI0020CD70FD|nr:MULTISPECIES: adenylate/guanylate cyclase domain-containing protein [unclassified Synechococcus]MCP9818873.1 adenylate/guanylate cyclase domain-containing protein [Synechococcus sp. Cruz-9H2]MCP9843376.1 adenylate/guanylate cyclase domain-containing protein [Synechococcus sp. Edmonson 11F2]MCP9855241.1 adenylate/guanylate cyclase domain-containing protein [Synechococcus sp. Cruz-9C9]MCP9862786.1 adenylate/guanylate cyclase domain-containing protein [Synechococcus sp. Cruz-7E5]MCP9869783.1 a